MSAGVGAHATVRLEVGTCSSVGRDALRLVEDVQSRGNAKSDGGIPQQRYQREGPAEADPEASGVH